MVPDKDIEDCETINKMNTNASRVADVNHLSRQPLHVDHPGSDEIVARQNQPNPKWLPSKKDQKQGEENLTLDMVLRPSIMSVMKLSLGLRTR